MVKRDWDYFQNDSNLTINVYIRNARKENVTVEIFERAVNVSVKTADGRDIIHDFDPLLHPIIAAESSFEVLSTKIEIVLKKATAGKLWPELTGDDVAVAAETESAESAALSASAKAAAGFAPPSYPSSSRFGPKNWDKIGKEAEKEEEEVRKKHGDGNIFGLLYKDADEDTKRAMMKSYQESGGTCLSMNWKEVGKQRTKIEPPEGMVAKKYEY
ncbi:SGS-domain-containing protein [Ramicandelaber brevisporus]|nr:SGS-domain-containing protein [Ramicandelaber brevisporus]